MAVRMAGDFSRSSALFADRSRVAPELVEAWVERRRDPVQRKAFLRLLRRGAGLGGVGLVLGGEDAQRDGRATTRAPASVVVGPGSIAVTGSF